MIAMRAVGAVDQRPVAPDSMREKRRVFVLWLHHHAHALKSTDVVGQRQRHTRPAARKSRIRYAKLAQLRHICTARIPDSPELLLVVFRVWQQCGLWVEFPAINAVF